MESEFINEVRIALRIKNEDEGLTKEIEMLIEACKEDLKTTGIKNEQAVLYKLAIITYCKAHFGYDNPDRDKLISSYNMMKEKMMNTREYNEI